MKILVSDYDGTFYTCERDIRINCRKVQEFIDEGNLFVLSSGRSLKSLKDRVQAHNIPYSYLACCDGSFLFDKDGMMHVANIISHDVVKLTHELEVLKRHRKLEYAYLDDYHEDYDNIKLLGSVAITIDGINIDDKFRETFAKIKEEHPEYQYDIYGYNGVYYYLIRPHGVSKASPIEYLEEKYKVPKSEIYTIGDNTNDFELIRDYNGFSIGDNKDIEPVSLKRYKAVHRLIKDINKGKVLKRW